MLDRTTLAYAERLARAYRGLDALHRAANPEDPWGLVVLDMADDRSPTAFAGWDAARAAFGRLAEEAVDLNEGDRRRYYADLCRSALTVIAWNERDGALPLEEQVAGFLATEPRPASDAELDAVRRELARELAAAGHEGPLSDAARSWEAATRVVTDDLVPTMERLMDEALERTAAVFDVPMPRLPKVTLVRGAAFNARCDFARGVVELNADPVITLGDLRHLVVHEVVPGHCLQFETRKLAVREGWGGADGLMSLVKSAGSPLFEGVADAGNELIGWKEPVDRITELVSRLRAGIGTVAAWGLHREGWGPERARAYLAENALMGGAGWVENRLGYIAPKGRGAHVWSYWLGEQALRPVYAGHRGGAPAHDLRTIYGRMHSLASLAVLVAGEAR